MKIQRGISRLSNQRGVALPMAILALLMLSALVIGFSVLSATEPTIANNQLMVAQARAVAEAGVEQAIWALNNPAAGIPTPIARADGAAAAPYDGTQLVPVFNGGINIGGFMVTVTGPTQPPLPPNGLGVAERRITSVGWVPNATPTNPHQKITVTVWNPQLLLPDPPAALSVRGELEVGGTSIVDSTLDTSCGKKVGTLTTGKTELKDAATTVWGATDNNTVPNQVTDANNGPIPANAGDVVKNLATSSFDKFILTDSDINALRAYAKANGTYLQGSVTYNAGNKIPNGLVFVDTVSGSNITQEGITPATLSSDFGSVRIDGNPAADPSGIFSGWLFVNGSLSVNGAFVAHGMLYAQNDIVYHGIGTGRVEGAMMSRNIRDLSSTSIDSDLLGNAKIVYNCAYARTGGGINPINRWTMETGPTACAAGKCYKEVSGS